MFEVPNFYETPPMASDFWTEMAGVAGVIGVLILLYFFILFLTVALSIASYVLHSAGLYTIATRRGIHHSWLAWFPVGNLWLLGSVSDQYQYVAKGKIKNRRLALLLTYVAVLVLYIAWLVIVIASSAAESTADGMAAGSVIGVLVAILATFVLGVILAVFQYLAYYDLFVSCNPNNAVLFLVLSIVFPVTLPFFVFACRKRDDGMPPRKKNAVQKLKELMQEDMTEPEQPDVPEQPEEMADAPVTEEGYAQPEEFEEE